MEASVKLRISSVDCLSAASFGAARSEQLRLPAEEPLERRDGSSRCVRCELKALAEELRFKMHFAPHSMTEGAVSVDTRIGPLLWVRRKMIWTVSNE